MAMFWDKVSPLYDFFETVYNRRVYTNTGKCVAAYISSEDTVLECACGTGAISEPVAQKCRLLIATDMAEGMLRKTYQKCSKYGNVKVRHADLMHLKCRNNRFDKVIAGNVIHLLDDPEAAIRELLRVCKPGGKVIIPTYINRDGQDLKAVISLLEKIGVHFKRQFDFASYKQFFADAGYPDAEFSIVEGKMSCAIAVIQKTAS
ncbi:MAG: class I SAM-dependent methyltransferase [Oscillospiraceae bacterium]|nr:class I SAM-dependent methyltransferase [Oscillospiraceae bacterium]